MTFIQEKPKRLSSHPNRDKPEEASDQAMLKQSINLIPARRDLYQASMVFYLFLASLGMFFFGSLITYLVIRDQAFRPIPDAVPNSIATMGPEIYQPLTVPMTFWISTVVLVLVGILLQRASWLVHRERQVDFRRLLMWAWFAAVVFLLIQGWGMKDLLTQHFSQSDGSTKVYGMSFTLSFIHALHVLGGMAFLGFRYFPGISQPLRSRTTLGR